MWVGIGDKAMSKVSAITSSETSGSKEVLVEKMLRANHRHLSADEWEYFDLEVYEWPSGATGPWFHRVCNEDVTIYVGFHEGDFLEPEDLEGVSEGLAGLCRAAWAVGASWLHLTTYDQEIDGVPCSLYDEEELA